MCIPLRWNQTMRGVTGCRPVQGSWTAQADGFLLRDVLCIHQLREYDLHSRHTSDKVELKHLVFLYPSYLLFSRRIGCMGEESCYSLAFGVPAILMAIALCNITYNLWFKYSSNYCPVSFWVGSRYYKKIIPERNIVTLFFKCSWVSSA